jgi:8-oxo-dGTP pyrophosphatase MutT (NUDIX family)
MTCEELFDILSLNFEQMWYRIWLTHDNRDLFHKKHARFQSVFMRNDSGAGLRHLCLSARGRGALMWEVPKGRRQSAQEPDLICAVRELREETGLTLAADALQPFWFTSTAPRPNRVLLFGASSVTLDTLPAFRPTDETAERGVIFGPDGLAPLFAFDLHLEAARRWFAARGNTGPHEYEPA